MQSEDACLHCVHMLSGSEILQVHKEALIPSKITDVCELSSVMPNVSHDFYLAVMFYI